MRKVLRPTHPISRRMAALVDELDLPLPFTFEGFRATLEQHCHGRVILAATAMPPGAPSGVWLRTDAADYLHYEERTSPFHQAHIIATLAAHLLLTDRAAEMISSQLVPDINPQGDKQFHGTAVGDVISRPEVEAFAFEVLRRTGSFPGPLQSRMLLRRLQPLRSALLAAAPSAASEIAAEPSPGATARLCRSVIEIRDAALALRPHETPDSARDSKHKTQAQSTNLSAGIAVEPDFSLRRPAALDARLWSEQSGDLLRSNLSADLRAEALALVRAAEAFNSTAVAEGKLSKG